jgi:hypothetical protein
MYLAGYTARRTLTRKGPEIISTLWESGRNQGDLPVFDQYVDSEFVNHASSFENRKGLDGLKTPASAIRRALPDLQMEIVGIWEVTETNGDIVVFAHTIMTGTHQGKPAFHGHLPWREIN